MVGIADMVIDDFRNRLIKRARHIARYVRQNNISSYRLYDRDVPGVPITIDIYKLQEAKEEAQWHSAVPNDPYVKGATLADAAIVARQGGIVTSAINTQTSTQKQLSPNDFSVLKAQQQSKVGGNIKNQSGKCNWERVNVDSKNGSKNSLNEAEEQSGVMRSDSSCSDVKYLQSAYARSYKADAKASAKNEVTYCVVQVYKDFDTYFDYAQYKKPCIDVIVNVTGVDAKNIILKTRARYSHKDGSQYNTSQQNLVTETQVKPKKVREFSNRHIDPAQYKKGYNNQNSMVQSDITGVINEGDFKFFVNLTRYIDTGLFSDMRLMRERVKSESTGRRVLNLFSYTGSFTVAALSGGAASVTSVDLSTTYLDWARANIVLNGYPLKRATFIKSDSIKYLKGCREKYDIIICDPPTFSNSKGTATFDVKRDYKTLIELCLKVSAPGGVLYFSTNAKGFSIDLNYSDTLAQRYDTNAPLTIKDITSQTIPKDFLQAPLNREVHKVYRIAQAL